MHLIILTKDSSTSPSDTFTKKAFNRSLSNHKAQNGTRLIKLSEARNTIHIVTSSIESSNKSSPNYKRNEGVSHPVVEGPASLMILKDLRSDYAADVGARARFHAEGNSGT